MGSRIGTHMKLDRRGFLQVSALGLAAAIVQACKDERGRALDQPALIATLGADRVLQLGVHYRAQTPAENNADTLRSAIEKARGSRLLGKSIDDTVRDDFAKGRTVLVDGWVLSVTEARQAALLSFTRRT
jgi:hypothetical protein